MDLVPPKRTSAGFQIVLTTPAVSPPVEWHDTTWTATPAWQEWADDLRMKLLGTLLSHGNWFSKPPRRDVLENLFSPWAGRTMQGSLQFFCSAPTVPSGVTSGHATWILNSILLTASAVRPEWSIGSVEPDSDQISIFGGSTVDGEDEEPVADGETREIQLEEIEAAPPETPTRIRNRDWEARKFLAKERVREARLKAQIAERMARKEESRFYAHFGELDETESRFSDYDLTEDEASDSGSGSDSDGA